MRKLSIPVVTFAFAISASQLAFAGPLPQSSQDDGPSAAETERASTGLLRQNSIAPTGQTVPRPGSLPQGHYAPTPIERLDNKIDTSICKGC